MSNAIHPHRFTTINPQLCNTWLTADRQRDRCSTITSLADENWLWSISFNHFTVTGKKAYVDKPWWFSAKYFWASTIVGLNASDLMIVSSCSTLWTCLSLVFSEKQSRNSAHKQLNINSWADTTNLPDFSIVQETTVSKRQQMYE